MIEHNKPKRKKKKKKRKHKVPLFPPMFGLPPMPQMYGGMPQAPAYPPYYGGSQGGFPGYGNNMSALAGAGLNALNMPNNNYEGLENQYNSHMNKHPADFDDPKQIVDGRDINKDNKEQLKALLASQLGNANHKSQRDRPPTYN